MSQNIKFIIFLFITIFLFGIFLWEEDYLVTTSHYNIVNEKIPDEFVGYKIAQISDVHSNNSPAIKYQLRKYLQKEQPDIIVITGDLVDRQDSPVYLTNKFIKSFEDIAPIYFTTGNHDNGIIQREDFIQALEAHNVKILDDEIEFINRKNKSIALIGLSNMTDNTEERTKVSDKITTILTKTHIDNDTFTILLYHKPDAFPAFVTTSIDLALCGHAHGGQIRVPFIGGLYAPNQGVLPKYTNGMFQENETTMIVNRGIGNSRFPFRINNHPEISIVTLSK